MRHRRQFENDDAQLCAQGLCLEEMLGITVERGALFHAANKRSRDFVFTTELRTSTGQSIAELHRLAESGTVPQAAYRPARTQCSLFEVCLPKAAGGDMRIEREARRLFETPN
jgi:CRISPR-associated exonuclease Cas4